MARSARMHLFALMLSGVSSRCQVDRSSLVAGLSLSQLATTHAGFRVLRGFTHTVSRHPASPTRRQRQSPDTHLLLHPWQEDRVLYRQLEQTQQAAQEGHALLPARGEAARVAKYVSYRPRAAKVAQLMGNRAPPKAPQPAAGAKNLGVFAPSGRLWRFFLR